MTEKNSYSFSLAAKTRALKLQSWLELNREKIIDSNLSPRRNYKWNQQQSCWIIKN
ncbi:MAG: hypothetical protein WC784_02215 [Candidatus Shapirobacteria bacterium]|jgi:hypothetical protein